MVVVVEGVVVVVGGLVVVVEGVAVVVVFEEVVVVVVVVFFGVEAAVVMGSLVVVVVGLVVDVVAAFVIFLLGCVSTLLDSLTLFLRAGCFECAGFPSCTTVLFLSSKFFDFLSVFSFFRHFSEQSRDRSGRLDHSQPRAFRFSDVIQI